jgi:folylpolyglutamate synthase/dihydropteroate synthase
MLRHIYWFSGHMFLTKPPNERALDPAELADQLSRVIAESSCGCGDPACLQCSAESGPFFTLLPTPEDALRAAITRAQHVERGAVVVCGSLYLISAIRKLLV